MGRRACYVVKEGGALRFGYTHGGAPWVLADLTWGPEHFMLTAHFHCEAAGVMDEIWAEGGVTVDFDAKRVVAFGGENVLLHAGFQRAWLALARTRWPGW